MQKNVKNQKNFKIFCATLLVFCMCIASLCGIQEAAANVPNVSTPLSKALTYLHSVQQSDGSIAGYTTSEWATMAIAAAGQDPHNWKVGGGPSIVDYLIANRPTDPSSDPETGIKNIERFVLAMTASGENPYSIYGTDYVAMIRNNATGGQIGFESQLNDDWWGVMALISAGESASSATVSNSVAYIKNHQNLDGGWGYGVGVSSDAEDTAAAIMALRCAGESSAAPYMKAAVQYLKNNQQSDGGFTYPGYSTNTPADSWVIGAIVSVGQHPAQWPVIGTNVMNHLLSLQSSSGLFYWYGTVIDHPEWMTSYAIQAMSYAPYPVNIHYTVHLAGDFTSDNKINYVDISTFMDAYIAYYSGQTWSHTADFNGDNKLNYLDISMFMDYYIGYYS